MKNWLDKFNFINNIFCLQQPQIDNVLKSNEDFDLIGLRVLNDDIIKDVDNFINNIVINLQTVVLGLKTCVFSPKAFFICLVQS